MNNTVVHNTGRFQHSLLYGSARAQKSLSTVQTVHSTVYVQYSL